MAKGGTRERAHTHADIFGASDANPRLAELRRDALLRKDARNKRPAVQLIMVRGEQICSARSGNVNTPIQPDQVWYCVNRLADFFPSLHIYGGGVPSPQ